ncbi:MAG: hypothetical protein ACUVTH_12510 [Thermogutta sp.]
MAQTLTSGEGGDASAIPTGCAEKMGEDSFESRNWQKTNITIDKNQKTDHPLFGYGEFLPMVFSLLCCSGRTILDTKRP